LTVAAIAASTLALGACGGEGTGDVASTAAAQSVTADSAASAPTQSEKAVVNVASADNAGGQTHGRVLLPKSGKGD
jgi:hypothetical protein